MKQFPAAPKFRPERCSVYLHLPLFGFISTRFEKQVKLADKQCFSAANHVLFTLPTRNVLPALQKSNVIYQF